MANQTTYVSLDIGTTAVKVVVAESVKGQINILSVGYQHTKGLSRGVIVDIDATVDAIKKAVKQAEQKANINIQQVAVGVPSNQIAIEPCHGMIAVSSENREITNKDVDNVISAAKVRSVPPEREIISILPEEFIVDGFDGIRDPRGMIGVKLELYASLITGPKTILHNIKRCVEKAGLRISELVVQPLAISQVALNEGERKFGAVLIDLGGGQTSAAIIHEDQLKFTFVDQEGGDYITQDISKIWGTTIDSAERIKREYGYALPEALVDDKQFPVEVVGKRDPAKYGEKYLAEIIESRLVQIFETVKHALDRVGALKLPGGVVLTGGSAALPGVAELAEEILGVPVKLYIPSQMGMRHPMFATSIGLVQYVSGLDDIHRLAQTGKTQPQRTTQQQQPVVAAAKAPEPAAPSANEASFEEEASSFTEEKPRRGNKFLDKIRSFFDTFEEE